MAQKTSPNLRVRAARSQDLGRLSVLLADSFHSREGMMGLVYPVLEFSIREDLRYRLQRSASYYACLVAVQYSAGADSAEPKIVGTIEMSARSFPTWWPSDRRTYISNLAVDRRCRRLGIARKLLATCEHISLDWGVSTLSLHVMVDNTPARQLYRQVGYNIQRQGGIGGLFQSSRRLLLHKRVV